MPRRMNSHIVVCIIVCSKAAYPRKNVHNPNIDKALQNEITHVTASASEDELQKAMKNVFMYCEA
jgi:hypothetical protein